MGRFRRHLPYIYLLVLALCLIYTICYTAQALKVDYVDIPTWDAWQCVRDLDQLCRLDLRPLWRQHYEHRVIGVQLLYWLDFGLLHGHQLLPLILEIVCQLAQLGLLWWLIFQQKQILLPFRLALAAMCGILMTTAIHVQAMVIPFLVQWYLTQALEPFALLSLWKTAQTGRSRWLVLAMAATVTVMYTTGNGMLLWPVLVLMACWLSIRWKYVAALTITAIVSVAVYFIGYSFAGQGKAILLVTHPLYAAEFAAILLGAPASYISNAFGCIIGLIGAGLTIFAFLLAVRRRAALDMVFVIAAGYALFTIASAVMAAEGRMNIADPTFLKAKAVRYAMIALTFWADLVVLIAWLLRRVRRQSVWHAAAAALVVLLLAAVMGQQRDVERRGAARQAWAATGAMGLETGVQDLAAFGEIYQDPSVLWEQSPVLRRRRLAIFAAGRQEWMGHTVRELFPAASPDHCAGSLQMLRVVDNGVQAEGRAFDTATHRPVADILLADSEGVIAGLGATRADGYPCCRDQTRLEASDGVWVGFARAARQAGTLQAYAVVGSEKQACPLGAAQPMPVRGSENLAVLWAPDRPPQPANASIERRTHWIEVMPANEDPQLLFNIGSSLGNYRTVVIRARFAKHDRIDAFFGRQVEGRGIYGVVPVTHQWVDVYLNLSHNQFWQTEHGQNLRFDPVSSAGPGTSAEIAGIWGSTEAAPADWPNVQFYPVPKGEEPEP